MSYSITATPPHWLFGLYRATSVAAGSIARYPLSTGRIGLVFSYVYELPWMKQQKNVLGYIVGGWQVSGLTAYESGNPYTVTNGQDSDGLEGNDRPNFNPSGRPGARAVPAPLSESPTGYINPDVPGPNGTFVRTPIDPKDARLLDCR